MPRQFSGSALRRARLAAGLSPEQVAVATDRTAASINGYELGRTLPPATVIGRLADLFRVTVDDFFAQEEVTTP